MPDFLDLENVVFSDPTPFERILFEFIVRFTLSGVLWLIILPTVLYLVKDTSPRDFVDLIRLNSGQITSRTILTGLTISISFFICVVLTAILLGVYTSDFYLLTSPDYENGLGWFVFIFALIPGIWEEVVFRGIIFTFLVAKCSVRKAILFDALLFSFFHIFNYILLDQDLLSVLLQSIAAIPVGISLAYLVLSRDSILPAIMVHYSIDVTLFISGFIFDLSNDTSASIFALVALLILPPLLIILFTRILENKDLDESTNF
ncbi:MAG: CPBP family intramembrane glutamic endopeptidase [Candidatus Hodarchaeales archaeon]